jgi:hypothetical protein
MAKAFQNKRRIVVKRYKPLIVWEYHNGFSHARVEMVEDEYGEYVTRKEAEQAVSEAAAVVYVKL